MFNKWSTISLGNSVVNNNIAPDGGGIFNYDARVLVNNTLFGGNYAQDLGGGVGALSSYNSIDNSVFDENLAYVGGAVLNFYETYSNVFSSTFENNMGYEAGGAIANGYGVLSYVDSSIFKNNDAEFGGGVATNTYSEAVIMNSVFVGNTSYGYGAGVATWDMSEALILNDTFTGNVAYQGGGGAIANGPDGQSEISNTILWDDMAVNVPATSEIFDYYYGDHDGVSYVFYSDIMGGWGGYGADNINADPLFVNAPADWDVCRNTGTTTTLEVVDGSIYQVGDVIEINMDGVARTVTAVVDNTVTFSPAFSRNTWGGDIVAIWGVGVTNIVFDLSLRANSPAIDAGWAASGYAPAVDILGNPRPSGATWDMGAYEYQQ